MGEVYRARDTRLRREVALKLLPDAAAHDADSLHRFDRETRAVATLNHPSILAIHDTGSFRAVPYAVTELLEGESLADRLRTGPLHPQKAVEVACQIADGLAAAHEKGIIHRDIKPENIFLTARAGEDPRLRDRAHRATHADRRALRHDHAQPGLSGSGSSSSAPPGTCRPSRCAARRSMAAPTCFRWAPRSSRCSRAAARSCGTARSRRSARCSRDDPQASGGREDPRRSEGLRLPLPREGPGRSVPVGPRPAARPARVPGRAAPAVRRARHVPVGASVEAAADARGAEGARRRPPVRSRTLGGLLLGAERASIRLAASASTAP